MWFSDFQKPDKIAIFREFLLLFKELKKPTLAGVVKYTQLQRESRLLENHRLSLELVCFSIFEKHVLVILALSRRPTLFRVSN